MAHLLDPDDAAYAAKRRKTLGEPSPRQLPAISPVHLIPPNGAATTTEAQEEEAKYTLTTKAYKNMDFLNSRAARSIRIMCEFEETRARLKANHIEGTLLVFGSARSMFPEDHKKAVDKLTDQIAKATDAKTKNELTEKLERLKKSGWMSEYCNQAQELAKRLTEWTMTAGVRINTEWIPPPAVEKYLAEPGSVETSSSSSSRNRTMSPTTKAMKANNLDEFPQRFVVCTGGGPGLMEAANRGAAEVPGARNMGMTISLPFEKGLNPSVTQALAFEFHYFFTRKFWMVYQAKAIVVFPGGFGTFDELFETCTLKQTGKLHGNVPIVLFGKKYWEKVINWQFMVDCGTISQKDYDDLFFTDDVTEAYNHIVTQLASEKDLFIKKTVAPADAVSPANANPPSATTFKGT